MPLDKTLTIGISSRQTVNDCFLTAFETGQPQGAHISFESEEMLWKTTTLKRWQILKVMTGAGELAIREVARRVDRDVKAMHGASPYCCSADYWIKSTAAR